jgi:hypothetical protein
MGRPSLTATIQYSQKVWFFSVSARNIQILSLLSLFGNPTEQQDFKEFLGHLILETLSFSYTHDGPQASDLKFIARIVFKSYLFAFEYTRGTSQAGKSSQWQVTMSFEKQLSDKAVTLVDILKWLTNGALNDDLPDFLTATELKMDSNGFKFSIKGLTTAESTTTTLSAELKIGTLTANIARSQSRPKSLPDGAEKPKAICVLQVSLGGLPRPPPIPIVGQMEQPFKLELQYCTSDLTNEHIDVIRQSATYFSQARLPSSQGAKNAIVMGKGCIFTLLAGDTSIISSKPKSKQNPADGKSKDEAGTVPAKPDAPPSEKKADTDMKPYSKKVNAISISNIGLEYKSESQTVVVKFNATAQLGPIEVDLIGFGLEINFSKCKGIHPREWANLDLNVSLNGLGISMTGPTLTIAGFLERIKEIENGLEIEGYQGGIGVKFTPYTFIAFGSYKDVKGQGDSFSSFFVYAMLQGPLLKTPYVEIKGISGGFGYGSQLTLPGITEIQKFPLLMDADPNPQKAFKKLQDGNSGGTQFISIARGSMWFAVGILATAMETVDVSALLTLQISPTVTEIGILGTAKANLPRGASPDKSLACIELDFVGKINLTQGTFRFDGQIGTGSFLLSKDCRPTGGFMVCAWFSPSPHSGDWCISIGGWHPAYVPKAHYPPPPPRLQIAWRYSDNLSIMGQAYAALTPDALMGGALINVMFNLGNISAYFNAQADFIMQFHPLYYQAKVSVIAGVSYEIRVFGVSKKLGVDIGAMLELSGPPFSGKAHFEVCVVNFDFYFGAPPSVPNALSLQEFVEVVQKADKDKPKGLNPDHVLAIESGAIPQNDAPNAAQTPDKSWIVRGADFTFTVMSRVAVSAAGVVGTNDKKITSDTKIWARPMQLTEDGEVLKSEMTIRIINTKTKEELPNFRFEEVRQDLPMSLWGVYESNPNAMLNGGGRASTVSQMMGLRISVPASQYSKENPFKVRMEELQQASSSEATLKTDVQTDIGFIAIVMKGRLGQSGKSAYLAAKEALQGHTNNDQDLSVEVTTSETETHIEVPPPGITNLNERRRGLLEEWAKLKGLKRSQIRESETEQPAPREGVNINSDVPERFVNGLERFCHMAPRVTVS